MSASMTQGPLEKEFPYRYETHCHCCWCSACAQNEPQEMAQAYWERGYAGMVLTDHFLRGNTAVDRHLPWEEKMLRYWEAYQAAKDWGNAHGFSVFFGLEHQYGGGKEVLTYGLDLEFLLAHPDLHQLPFSEYAALVHQAGGFLSMAHPFRDRPYIDMTIQPQPEFLDGAEVFNYFNRGTENQQASQFVKEHHLLPTSGGDVHRAEDPAIGMAGVALRRPAGSIQELIAAWKARDYCLIIQGELKEL